MKTDILGIFRSPCFWAACFSWTLAQLIKMLLGLRNTRQLDFSYIVSTGGMPSAHSALVSGLCTCIGLSSGFTTPVFTLSMAFALITMFDASTVRRAAGQQARLLNQIVEGLFKKHKLPDHDKLKELLGHTRLEVFMGMIIGILVGILVKSISILS